MNKMFRSPLFLMALTIFIDIAGFGLILPLLPFWAEHLGANPTEVGLILTIYALAQFIFTPILGTLSDRFGRKPIIIGSLLIEAFSLALTGFAGSLTVLLIARFIGGIGASNIGSAQAVVADVTPPEGRARGMGMIGAAIGLGFRDRPCHRRYSFTNWACSALHSCDGSSYHQRASCIALPSGDPQSARNFQNEYFQH